MKQVQSHFDIANDLTAQLKRLVSLQTCYWMDDQIAGAIAYCKDSIRCLPDHWKRYVDSSGNLFVLNAGYDNSKPMLYLTAHIDTVGADDMDWLTPPFEATETTDYIIGRGANDCKAGVALILSVIECLSDDLHNYNVGFIIMYREEGNQGKSSAAINFNNLPISKVGTYIITLENTVSIQADGKYELGVYNSEPHNLFITLNDTTSRLREYIPHLVAAGWMPVVIEAECVDISTLEQYGVLTVAECGHVATAASKISKIADLLLSDLPKDIVLMSGTRNEASVIAPTITLYKGAGDKLF